MCNVYLPTVEPFTGGHIKTSQEHETISLPLLSGELMYLTCVPVTLNMHDKRELCD